MTRTVNPTGTGLQLWQVKRMYVELYSDWPSTTPSEVWGPQVVGYTLPRNKLGCCLEGDLQVVTVPGALPAGFVASSGPGRPVSTTLSTMTRLARVIAVLPNNDEVVIYTAVIGTPQAQDPRLWRVPLIALDSLKMQEFAQGRGAPPTPAGLYPLAAGALVTPKPGALGSAWSIPVDQYTPLTTLEAWWKTALQDSPVAEYGVGPDLVFAAGLPALIGAAVRYSVDGRAMDLKSAGRTTPPFLTKLRRWVQGTPEFQPLPVNLTRASNTLPRFVATRTAGVGGQIVTSVTSVPLNLSVSGGGSVNVADTGQTNQQLQCTIPVINGRVQDVDMVAHLSISNVTGQVAVYLLAQAHNRTGGFSTLYQDQKLAVPGSYDLQVKVDAKSLDGVDYITYIVGLQGLATGAQAGGTVSPGPASMRYEYTSYSTTYQPDPPGVNYPLETDEAFNLSLPGIHAGPYIVDTLPNGAEQYATTVIRNDGGSIYSELQCGPLPYQNSPVNPVTGRWTG